MEGRGEGESHAFSFLKVDSSEVGHCRNHDSCQQTYTLSTHTHGRKEGDKDPQIHQDTVHISHNPNLPQSFRFLFSSPSFRKFLNVTFSHSSGYRYRIFNAKFI